MVEFDEISLKTMKRMGEKLAVSRKRETTGSQSRCRHKWEEVYSDHAGCDKVNWCKKCGGIKVRYGGGTTRRYPANI